MKDVFKEFKPSSWAIDNRTATYVITVIITLMGLFAFLNLPKEQFPEIKIPQIIVQTVYPGTSPENMENLVSKPIEKQTKNLTGVKKVTSNSFQDYSVVVIEFNTDVKIEKAKKDVKDAVDKAKQDLPKNLPYQPEVNDIDLSEMPILSVNISGDYDLGRLKKYADKIKDNIEGLKQVKQVNRVGALDREIQINVDMYKMQAAGVTFDDIDRAIASENLSTTAGEVSMNSQKRVLSLRNEFKRADQIADLIVKNPYGQSVYLKNITQVIDTFADQKSYARLDNKNVITLNIIKAKGANLIEASDNVQAVIKKLQDENAVPKDLHIVTTGDQSETTRNTLHDLINTIIIGFLLVTLILMFFMGVTNALFVALSVPLSCAIAFLFLPTIGFTLNMVVLFSFLLALGIVVDDAIVVIENTHRIFDNGKMDIVKAAKFATGEVFLPVLSGTATTLMPFIPLAFWKGVIGSFMFFLPTTLMITLIASLLVAYIINPVFAVSFMKPEKHETGKKTFTKGNLITAVCFGVLALIFYISPATRGLANFIVIVYLFILLEKYVLSGIFHRFQNRTWPAFREWYTRVLRLALKRPLIIFITTLVMLPLSIMFNGARKPPFVFFPQADPNFAYVYLNLPVGTDQARTNEVLKELEAKVNKVLDNDPEHGKHNPLVKSVIANVTVDAVDPGAQEVGDFPNKGKISVAFVEFKDRKGASTLTYLNKIREVVKSYPGAEITVDQESGGPPQAKPIVIELTGENLDTLVAYSEKMKRYLKAKQIPGVEELRSDFDAHKPEIVFDVDRERMNSESISTYQVAMTLRTAIFGKEVSRFRDANDDYPINLRLMKSQRADIDAVRNLPIVFRDMGMGGAIRSVPVSAFANVHYGTTYGAIKRKDQKRIISLFSNVIKGYEDNDVVAAVQKEVNEFHLPAGINVKMGGQQEDQAETMSFLLSAFGISMLLIVLTLILQFNSLSRTVIIMSEILFSITGVMLGFGIFRNTFSLVMSGIGIVALAGIVVRNGILLVEFMDLMIKDGMSRYDAIVEAGRTRMTPVLLTATAAILGLVPLAVGLNIDFGTLLTTFNPHIFFGGDSAAIWASLAWTMIYGLSFATLITLIAVPAMCLLSFQLKDWLAKTFGWSKKEQPAPEVAVTEEA
ncbi:MAG: efflux RND transporter permease subunit [Chitinophagia bacterium]|nr:efflux RND transporter permease subunit [Chitinophagia bacterium]